MADNLQTDILNIWYLCNQVCFPCSPVLTKERKAVNNQMDQKKMLPTKLWILREPFFFSVNEETLSHTSACSLEYRYGIKKN